MSELLGRVFWTKIKGELNDAVMCRSAHPNQAATLLDELEEILSQDEYAFFSYLILSGFDHLQSQDKARTDYQNAHDYIELKRNLKPLARMNKRLGSPFALPPEILDESYVMSASARYYEVLAQHPPQVKGRQPEGGIRHTINCMAKVLRQHKNRTKTADIISQILAVVYDEDKSSQTLLRRWFD